MSQSEPFEERVPCLRSEPFEERVPKAVSEPNERMSNAEIRVPMPEVRP